MKKAYESAPAGTAVVCLVPARTDTAWWFDYCSKGEIRFIRGRLKFGGSKHAAPFPSAVIVFSVNTLCKGIVKYLQEYTVSKIRTLSRGESSISHPATPIKNVRHGSLNLIVQKSEQ